MVDEPVDVEEEDAPEDAADESLEEPDDESLEEVFLPDSRLSVR